MRLQWMRWDQHGWDHYGPAQMYDVKVGARRERQDRRRGLDELRPGTEQPRPDEGARSGRPRGRRFPRTVARRRLLDAVYAAATYAPGFQYQRRMLAKTQPLYERLAQAATSCGPRTRRSQYFASEQIVDELAHAVNMDPIAFRRQNIDGTTTAGQRWLSVLDGATVAAGWKPKVAASNLQERRRRHRPRLRLRHVRFEPGRRRRRHRGEQEDGQDRRQARCTVAQNNGITVNLELRHHQMSGALIQGLSRALYEQADVEQGPGHEPRLGLVSDPALQGRSDGDARQRASGQVHRGEARVTTTPGRPGGQHGRVQRTAGSCPARASRPPSASAVQSRTRSSTPRVSASARRR